MQDKITKLFKAIADPTRRDIFHALVIATSALSITQISNPKELQEVNKWIKFYEQFWDDKLGSLGNYLDGKA